MTNNSRTDRTDRTYEPTVFYFMNAQQYDAFTNADGTNAAARHKNAVETISRNYKAYVLYRRGIDCAEMTTPEPREKISALISSPISDADIKTTFDAITILTCKSIRDFAFCNDAAFTKSVYIVGAYIAKKASMIIRDAFKTNGTNAERSADAARYTFCARRVSAIKQIQHHINAVGNLPNADEIKNADDYIMDISIDLVAESAARLYEYIKHNRLNADSLHKLVNDFVNVISARQQFGDARSVDELTESETPYVMDEYADGNNDTAWTHGKIAKLLLSCCKDEIDSAIVDAIAHGETMQRIINHYGITKQAISYRKNRIMTAARAISEHK